MIRDSAIAKLNVAGDTTTLHIMYVSFRNQDHIRQLCGDVNGFPKSFVI